MKNASLVDHHGKSMAAKLIADKVKHKIILAGARCFIVVFETKEDRKVGIEHITKNKPFEEFDYARMTKH